MPQAAASTTKHLQVSPAATLEDRMAVMAMLRELSIELGLPAASQRFGTVLSSLSLPGATGPGGFALLASRGGEPLGCLIVAQTPGRSAAIRWCYVRAGTRREGIGSAMMSETLRLARRRSWETITVCVTPCVGGYRALLLEAGFSVQRCTPRHGAVGFERQLHDDDLAARARSPDTRRALRTPSAVPGIVGLASPGKDSSRREPEADGTAFPPERLRPQAPAAQSAVYDHDAIARGVAAAHRLRSAAFHRLVLAPVGGACRRVLRALSAHRERQRARWELSALSDHLLKDVGLSRAQLGTRLASGPRNRPGTRPAAGPETRPGARAGSPTAVSDHDPAGLGRPAPATVRTEVIAGRMMPAANDAEVRPRSA